MRRLLFSIIGLAVCCGPSFGAGLTKDQARQVAADTLAYINKYRDLFADDAVMNQDALNKVFFSTPYNDLIHRWPAPYSDAEAGKYKSCHNLITSAMSYSKAQHEYAFKGLAEKHVLPLRRQFKEDRKDCKSELSR